MTIKQRDLECLVIIQTFELVALARPHATVPNDADGLQKLKIFKCLGIPQIVKDGTVSLMI